MLEEKDFRRLSIAFGFTCTQIPRIVPQLLDDHSWVMYQSKKPEIRSDIVLLSRPNDPGSGHSPWPCVVEMKWVGKD